MENWKELPGWEGYYAVSDLGRVMRLAGSPRCKTDRILKPRITEFGYLTVSPVRNGISQRPLCVHVLILETFAGSRPTPTHQGNHLNGIKTDNRLANLEWTSRAGNIKHSYDTGLHGRYRGSSASAAKLTEADVTIILDRIAGRHYRADIAADFGVSIKAIDEIVAGNHWTHVARPDLSGKRMGRQVLTEDNVREIRKMLGTMPHGEIAKQFGVSGPTIWQIAAGRTWQHVR